MVSTRASSRAEERPLLSGKPSSSSSSSNPKRGSWSHAPSRLTLLWLAISIPLVLWDTVYVLGRPHTMAGGFLHWPLYVPYALYAEIDYVYGWKAVHDHLGFTSAQGLLNAVEIVMYLVYLWMCYERGSWTLDGRRGGKAALVGLSAAVMTLSKTVLYWANEYYSGFAGIGHNAPLDLLFLWIIPNGAWLVGSGYMIFDFGGNILDGLAMASEHRKSA
ncbi:uncharacterized protein J7T54_000517 [Emericellopsis cladophorae]|uniref:C6 transcription factor n=1 Tax=Emericellopsis cladophorae TaxID=2686198 RepID=A0A9P9XW95_9HYPO|nr:uncharacterized protein J7T54_000517 [Emericellopsis cladophorae]KAI6778861.1 hypothetical protein J7T54_000517 [Emericellopsis cladophorae]